MGMGLKAPGILTFTLSVVLLVIAGISKYANAQLPVVDGHEFGLLLVAQLILILGCIMRGL
jgi:hypothetical protein